MFFNVSYSDFEEFQKDVAQVAPFVAQMRMLYFGEYTEAEKYINNDDVNFIASIPRSYTRPAVTPEETYYSDWVFISEAIRQFVDEFSMNDFRIYEGPNPDEMLLVGYH